MRIQGRVLRPSTLAERRVLKSLGLDFVRVPRRRNPFGVARLIRRISFGGPDLPKLKMLLGKRLASATDTQKLAFEPVELPDSTPTPREREQEEHAA
jgi:hypothetical protein